MASIASSGHSPLNGYDPLLAESTGDDESWGFIDPSGSSNSGSIGFFPSPPSGSLASYNVVSHQGQMRPSPPAPSPLYLDMEQAATFSMPYSDQAASLNVSGAPDSGFLTSVDGQTDFPDQFMPPQDYIFDDQQLQDLGPFLNTFHSNVPHTGLETFPQPIPEPVEIPQQLQTGPDVPPWDPTSMRQQDEGQANNMFIMEEFNATSSPSSGISASMSPRQSASPRSPYIKQEPGNQKMATATTVPSPIRKVRSARVDKRKTPSESSIGSSSAADAAVGKFVIMTPATVDANTGKQNPFECFEAMRTTQKGRKGPLANETKENALQVRRLGACFCCHARKVKCDAERPCKNCKKMAVQVPQVVCWQFQDFLTVLFPDFIRKHFKKEEMAKFMTENISSFTVDGEEKPCLVKLFSGAQWQSTLTVRAKFFTAKTADVLQHYHLTNEGQEHVHLQSNGSAPIGLDTDGASKKDELRRDIKEYLQLIIKEPSYADQLTDSVRHTSLPQRILHIVQQYCQRTDSPIVKKALSIYAMHYVMTRHLCLTHDSINSLRHTNLVPQNAAFVTSRVLNRQIKSIVDELLMREVQTLFESFSKSLKPKSRKEWAPCTAAFLVMCLFLETVELAGDYFVLSQNEVNYRNKYQKEFDRQFVLNLNQEVENMPFKQFAYQFHQIYQTHTKDATTKAFNPLVDDSVIEAGDLDPAGLSLVLQLRGILQGSSWRGFQEPDLHTLAVGPILTNTEDHPFPRDVAENYIGKLMSRFLLSFVDETYIFGLDETTET